MFLTFGDSSMVNLVLHFAYWQLRYFGTAPENPLFNKNKPE